MTNWHEVHDSRQNRPQATDHTTSAVVVYERRNIRQEDKNAGAQEQGGKEWVYEERELTREEWAAREAENTAVAASIAFVALAEAGNIDEGTAREHTTLFSPWAFPVAYTPGNIREYEGGLYRCVQAHTSAEEWTPTATPALWTPISDPAEEWPEWSQPIGAHDAYNEGDKVSHSGARWVSSVAGNVWEPGVYGWDEYAGEAAGVDLDSMTVAQLKAYAQENGIDISGKTLKADILAAIKAAG